MLNSMCQEKGSACSARNGSTGSVCFDIRDVMNYHPLRLQSCRAPRRSGTLTRTMRRMRRRSTRPGSCASSRASGPPRSPPTWGSNAALPACGEMQHSTGHTLERAVCAKTTLKHAKTQSSSCGVATCMQPVLLLGLAPGLKGLWKNPSNESDGRVVLPDQARPGGGRGFSAGGGGAGGAQGHDRGRAPRLGGRAPQGAAPVSPPCSIGQAASCHVQ